MMLLIAVSLYSCTKNDTTVEEPADIPPSADFSFTVGSGVYNSTATFTNKSLHGKTYFWDFGDGQTSTQKEPQHFYEKAGTFKVKLTVNNGAGQIATEKDVTVGQSYTKCFLTDLLFTGNYAPHAFDPDSDPDIYVVVTNTATGQSVRLQNTEYDCPAKHGKSWWVNIDGSRYPSINPFSTKITVAYWDEDNPPGDPDDLIEQFDFIPAEHVVGQYAFRPTLELYKPNASTQFRITWQY